MRPRSVILLLALVIALLAFIWFYERELPSSEERAELARRVWDFDRDQIIAVELQSEGPRVRLVRQAVSDPGEEGQERWSDHDWRVVEPFSARADRGLVDGLLNELVELEKKRTLEQVVAAEMGLEAPRATVRIETQRASFELLVGSEIPASQTMIVAIRGREDALVVADSLWSDVARPAGDWRSKEVFTFRQDEIERVSLEREGQRTVLARRGGEFWLEAPIVDRADSDKVRDLLTTLSNLRVAVFLDEPGEDVSNLGLEPEKRIVEVVLRDLEEPFRLVWGSSLPEQPERYYARVGGQVFEVESDLGTAIVRPAEGWRSMAITSFETFEVDELEVADPTTDLLTLQRAGADWKRDGEEISFTTVSDLLYALVGMEAARLLMPDQARAMGAQLDRPQLEITLRGEESSETVSFYPPCEVGVPVLTSGRQVVQLASPTDVEDILEKLDEVRAAESKTASDEIEQESTDSS